LKSHSKIIGIDPGKSGGLTVIDSDGIVAHKCPPTPEKMAILFGIALNGHAPIDVQVIMEQVWARPTNGSRHAFSYGTNYGLWFGIAAAHEIKIDLVSPQKWMKEIGCPKGMDVKKRKHWLKDKAMELYPSLPKVTLLTADSILIAHYGKHFKNNR